jgi:hypothetical protein
MARLRATASAARSVLDGCEHDGMLDRVGAAIADNQTIKSTPQKAIKKKADAYSTRRHRGSSAIACACISTMIASSASSVQPR